LRGPTTWQGDGKGRLASWQVRQDPVAFRATGARVRLLKSTAVRSVAMASQSIAHRPLRDASKLPDLHARLAHSPEL